MEPMELAKEGVEVIKQIETVDALDKAGAIVLDKVGRKAAYKLRTKKERIEDRLDVADQTIKVIQENLPKAADAVDKILADIILIAGEEAGNFREAVKEMAAKPHGSKVKAGRFKGFRIVYAGTKSYIELGENLFLYLTPDCVESVRFVCKKFRAKMMRNYYYYEVVFKDGSESFVRVSERHRKNLEQCSLQATSQTIFKELPPGENCADDEEYDEE